ncbi:hypothetical protein LAUMK35_04646 [Mycobacterium pseudokansasii]|nr:hypothetical protein LAUMK35_04646 [Mycobacterium pseudokansasii]VBA31686.1 hypothetical protein LAUMK21_04639 [Mycobacterium pseudokansasii]
MRHLQVNGGAHGATTMLRWDGRLFSGYGG